MKFNGTLTQWNDDRGFGFIKSAVGGPDIFVHIKSFEGQTARPLNGQSVTFEVEVSADGKKRAKRVLPAHFLAVPKRFRREPAGQFGTASWFAIPVFAAIYAVTHSFWRTPSWVAWAYLGTSVACFLAYAADKSAARAGGWRVSEQTLLILGLIGGWPGAIAAQQLLRHKSTKVAFRSVFWVSVLMNIIGFVMLCSPLAAQFIATR